MLYTDVACLLELDEINELWDLAHKFHVEKVPEKFKHDVGNRYDKGSLGIALFTGTKIFGCFDSNTGQMIGMLETYVSADDISKIRLKCLFVREEYRGKRVGKKLVKYLIEYFNKLSFFKTMEGKSYTKEGIDFWTKRGFEKCGNPNEFATLLRYTK